MNDPLEDELRLLFAEDATRAPNAASLLTEVRRATRPRDRRRSWVLAGVAAAATVVLAVAVGPQLGTSPERPDTTARPGAFQGEGALHQSGEARCVEDYSPAAVAGRAFAFDGTVSDIGEIDADQHDLTYVPVTFEVNEWFAGGSGEQVVVDMLPPTAVPEDHVDATYEIGTRLLVSGGLSSSRGSSEDELAWGCGFTRYYDQDTAGAWEAAVG